MESEVNTPRVEVEHGLDALQYPIFRVLCPELSDEEFEGMQTVVCGWLFTSEVPEA